MDLGGRHIAFVAQDVVVHRTGGTFDRSVGTEVKIVFERMRDSSLDKRAGLGV